MIELNIGPVQIRVGRPKPIKVNLLPEEPKRFVGIDVSNGQDKTVQVVGHREADGTMHVDYINTDDPKAHPKLRQARRLAIENGWREVWHRKEETRVRFKKGKDSIIDVWYTKMTVGTIITHPSRGRDQLFRKQVSDKLLSDIFRDPRVHTGEGYYKR